MIMFHYSQLRKAFHISCCHHALLISDISGSAVARHCAGGTRLINHSNTSPRLYRGYTVKDETRDSSPHLFPP